MTRTMVSMRLPADTIARLKRMARRYGSQSNTVVELVDAKFACPTCGERDMDSLVWNDDGETVTCASCGETYDPLAEEAAE